MAKRLVVDGVNYSVIGGTSAYIKVSITVPVLVDGVKQDVPISYSDAEISSVAYTSRNAVQAAEVSDAGNGQIQIKLSDESTANMAASSDDVLADLEVSARLKLDIANTQYKAGDKLGYRWKFNVEKKILA